MGGAVKQGRLGPVVLAILACFVAATSAGAAERYAILVSGAAGSEAHATQHAEWREALATALRERMKLPPERIIVLGDPEAERRAGREVSPDLLPATRDNVRDTFTRLAQTVKKEDVVFVVLFGHSTYDGVYAKFNLLGPDLEAADWKALTSPLAGRVVFVNTTGASAPFLQRLAGDNRIVITATDNPAQKYETVFPRYFVEAFTEPESDLDKDGRVSMWEAFAHASAGVRQYYRQRGQLAVEKSVLDDTGDGVGKDAAGTGPDGSLASRTFVDTEDDPARAAGPALSELINRRNVLEAEFDELKRRRSFMPPGDYEKRREELLIEIARVSRRIRAEQAKRS